MKSYKGEKVEGGKVERWKVEGGKVEMCTVLYYTIVNYSILYYSISNIRIQQRLLANYIPGDTQNLQRSTGYQFSSVRYYILNYGQKYIITFKHKTEHCFFCFDSFD